ncbi:retrovirus-related Pol polyprotein from transposon 17.6 [Trichonephila clavipes]|nr:retrovirus-related Pol polyprotein from transposon 17.6 [Trichonephila clavipes]
MCCHSCNGFQEPFFKQDNARPPTAKVSQDYLRTVATLPWPVQTPDWSPIKHIWDHLEWRVGHRTKLNELEVRLQQIWNEMSQDIIQNLYASMSYRIALRIRARGVQQGKTTKIGNLDILDQISLHKARFLTKLLERLTVRKSAFRVTYHPTRLEFANARGFKMPIIGLKLVHSDSRQYKYPLKYLCNQMLTLQRKNPKFDNYWKYLDICILDTGSTISIISHHFDAKFNWTDECLNALEKLKESLITKPILHLYDPDLTCHVFVDASQKRVGAVLKQPDASNVLHSIAYHSRTLRDYEKSFAITELECLAIIDALDKFYYYLHGQNFIIRTDPAALLWLKNVKNLRGQLFHWSLKLNQNSYYELVDEARELALQRTIDYHIKNKIRYDDRCIEKKFNPGDLVVYEEFHHRWAVSDPIPVVVRAMRRVEIEMNPKPFKCCWGKLPTKTTQPTYRIRTLTSSFAGFKEDMCTNDSLAADHR